MLSEMKIAITDGKMTMTLVTACQACGKEVLSSNNGDRQCFICEERFCYDCVRLHEYDCGKFQKSRPC